MNIKLQILYPVEFSNSSYGLLGGFLKLKEFHNFYAARKVKELVTFLFFVKVRFTSTATSMVIMLWKGGGGAIVIVNVTFGSIKSSFCR